MKAIESKSQWGKTEITEVEGHKEEWKNVRKSRSSINGKEKSRKENINTKLFHELTKVWNRIERIKEQNRISLHEVFVTLNTGKGFRIIHPRI